MAAARVMGAPSQLGRESWWDTRRTTAARLSLDCSAVASAGTRGHGLAKGWQIALGQGQQSSSQAVRYLQIRTTPHHPGPCDNGFPDSCPTGGECHPGIAKVLVRGPFCGGRGTRTHKPLRATVFKCVARRPYWPCLLLPDANCAGQRRDNFLTGTSRS